MKSSGSAIFASAAAIALFLGWIVIPCEAGELEPSPVERRVVIASVSDRGETPEQPQAAVDSQGRIVVVYGVRNRIMCVVSNDRGRSFEPDVEVGSVKSLSLGMRRGPRLAATDRGLVVTAIGGAVGMGRDGDLLAWHSADAGKTWTRPTRVNSVAGSAREGLHAAAGRSDGQAYACWLDLRNARTEIWGAASRDGGASWEPDRLVYRSPERSVCECCHPSVAFAPAFGPGQRERLHVMWRNNLEGNRDLFLSTSNDGGASFGEARKLGQGSWHLNACPMDGGAVATSREGRVVTVWMREQEVFLARPGELERRLGAGVQPWVAWGLDGPMVVWMGRGRDPTGPRSLLLRNLESGSPTVLAENAAAPAVASGSRPGSPSIVVWEDTTRKAIVAAVVGGPARGGLNVR